MIHTILIAQNFAQARLFAESELGLPPGGVDPGYITVTSDLDFDRVRGVDVSVPFYVLAGAYAPEVVAHLRDKGHPKKFTPFTWAPVNG